jgi:hypothetical protein
MPSLSHAKPLSIALSTPFLRTFAIATLMGATALAVPLDSARAGGITDAPIQLAQGKSPSTPTPSSVAPQISNRAANEEAKAETVDQRIDSLHSALQITPQEEPKWKIVAQTMHDNAVAMQKLAAETSVQSAQNMTAVDDLKTYEKFARAHVSGLRKLTASFEALYDAMPASQKKIADQVFQNFDQQRQAAAAHS